MKLKVCGMKYQENILAVAKLQPDYLGFIFHENSPRYFENIIPKIPNTIKKVGVFVNASIEEITEKIKKYDLQAVQLHGNETPEFCRKLKEIRHFERPDSYRDEKSHQEIPAEVYLERSRKAGMTEIIKVFSIKDTFNFEVLQPYENVCDYFLFDTKGKLPGGNGYAFNWNVLKNYPSTKPFFLSGGIGLDQIESVLSFLQRQESKYCYAIDVNSKFEIEPGLKNVEKLKEFKTNLSL
ncbi:MAG: phosphoribosylanthranilate isomerase [Bacteroidetes bacterium]|nr:phosphoribosylanthranilate isomerase [Bacteroidota bacterium]